jgi:glutamate N-acetyltransferase/amino-acid N-acetyltransferase
MDRVRAGLRAALADIDRARGGRAARAIMTTDTVSKEATETLTVDGHTVRIGAMAKGAGMIHPDMATMIAVITTDAAIHGDVIGEMLRRVSQATFNCMTVDTDTSTNDTVLLLANGMAGAPQIAGDSPSLQAFESGLQRVCDSLCEQMVADAEGATKYFRVQVRGAADAVQARQAARTVAGSPLVKTAIHGADPNWGRIVAAVGRSGAEFVVDRCSVAVGGEVVFLNGAPASADLEVIRRSFRGHRVDLDVDLGAGVSEGHAWGCDLSPEYVHINADYTT